MLLWIVGAKRSQLKHTFSKTGWSTHVDEYPPVAGRLPSLLSMCFKIKQSIVEIHRKFERTSIRIGTCRCMHAFKYPFDGYRSGMLLGNILSNSPLGLEFAMLWVPIHTPRLKRVALLAVRQE